MWSAMSDSNIQTRWTYHNKEHGGAPQHHEDGSLFLESTASDVDRNPIVVVQVNDFHMCSPVTSRGVFPADHHHGLRLQCHGERRRLEIARKDDGNKLVVRLCDLYSIYSSTTVTFMLCIVSEITNDTCHPSTWISSINVRSLCFSRQGISESQICAMHVAIRHLFLRSGMVYTLYWNEENPHTLVNKSSFPSIEKWWRPRVSLLGMTTTANRNGDNFLSSHDCQRTGMIQHVPNGI